MKTRMVNYRCNACGAIVKRCACTGMWAKSYCCATGRMARIYRVRKTDGKKEPKP